MNKKYLIAFFGVLTLCFPTYCDVDSNIDSYLNFYQKNGRSLGKKGEWEKGEIEILLDPSEISKAEDAIHKILTVKGLSDHSAKEYSRVGVVAEDTYFVWVRDPVIFPSGKMGTYDRIIPKSNLNGPTGVIIFPIEQHGKIVTILNFRHATRSWHLELPRGAREADETPEDAAFRELREETGYIGESQQRLGQVTPDSGILSSRMPVYLVRAVHQSTIKQDYSEAISGVYYFTKEELKDCLRDGGVELEINGKKKWVVVEDPYISYALLQAEALDLI